MLRGILGCCCCYLRGVGNVVGIVICIVDDWLMFCILCVFAMLFGGVVLCSNVVVLFTGVGMAWVFGFVEEGCG
jgi:hypothetical protein